MAKYAALNAEFAQMIAVAGKAAARQFDALDDATIGYLAGRYQVDALSYNDPLEAKYTASNGLLDVESYREDLQFTIDAHRDAIGARDYVSIRSMFADEAGRVAGSEGYLLEPDGVSLQSMCNAFASADIAVCEARIARSRGHEIEPPTQPIRIAPRQTGTTSSDVAFVTFGHELLQRPALAKGASTQQATRTSLRFFRELYGDMMPREIQPQHVRDYREALMLRPTKISRATGALALPELVRQYEGKVWPRQSSKTVNSHIANLSALWTMAIKEGEHPYSSLVNPFAGIRDGSNSGGRTGAAPEYSIDELNALFRLPVFTEHERPTRGKAEAAYWIPLLLLWTGARPNEIAQLNVADIYKDHTGWRIRITDQGEHETKGRQTLKTSRIGRGRRDFPLPQWLVENGLPAYARWVTTQGRTALFPRLTTKGERNDLYATFGEWWNAYVRSHGLLTVGGRNPGRELRHAWATAARKSRLREEEREYIQGHIGNQSSASRIYGSEGSLGDAIRDLHYDGLKLDHLPVWCPQNG